jgi:hypothetical protein
MKADHASSIAPLASKRQPQPTRTERKEYEMNNDAAWLVSASCASASVGNLKEI